MNILFITEIEPCSLYGGTSRITYSLSRTFEERGHRCSVAFSKAVEGSWEDIATGKVNFKLDNAGEVLGKAIRENKVEIVINNLISNRFKKIILPVLYDITRETGTAVVSCLHGMPGEELMGNTVRNSWYRAWNGYDLKRCVREFFLGVLSPKVTRILFASHFRKKYRLLVDYSDRVVLLSDKLREPFMKFAGIKDDKKLCSIHNVLSFNYFLPFEELGSKGREVLVVARMDEKSKRISRVLRIWNMVCRDKSREDWKLTIVGGGRDIQYFKRMAERLHLERISFEGWVEDNLEYYKRASIFMMTSAYEGWGITLTEAQQFGVVPIVFDSYPSLHDIIKDGKNGLFVPDKDYGLFYRKLTWLMDNEEERLRIAREAIVSSHRFTVENIYKEWLDLFDSLKS